MPEHDAAPAFTACHNIGPAQRRLRLKIGAVCITVAIAVIAILGWRGAPREWRLLALPPIWVGALSLLESRMRTCVLLAARGIRNMDDGNQPVASAEERRALKQRARRINLLAAVTALVLTALLIAL